MDCDKCENYNPAISDITGTEIIGDCQNFKPKQHPLQSMIYEMRSEYDHLPNHQIDDLTRRMVELRYESIKWALQYDGTAITDADVNADLKHEGHADWIVEGE